MTEISPRVLIVDDDPEFREMLAAYLAARDFAVDEVENGQLALDMLSSRAYDVVLCDEVMPGIQGTEVLAQALASKITAPFVMITGHGEGETVRTALRLGAFDFIDKPMKLAEILETVHRAVEFNKRQHSSDLATFERDRHVAALLRAVNGSRRKSS